MFMTKLEKNIRYELIKSEVEKAKENANENLSEVQYYKDIILKTINLAN